MSKQALRSSADNRDADLSQPASSFANPNRRSFLKGTMLAGAATAGAGLLAKGIPAFASSGSLTQRRRRHPPLRLLPRKLLRATSGCSTTNSPVFRTAKSPSSPAN